MKRGAHQGPPNSAEKTKKKMRLKRPRQGLALVSEGYSWQVEKGDRIMRPEGRGNFEGEENQSGYVSSFFSDNILWMVHPLQ